MFLIDDGTPTLPGPGPARRRWRPSRERDRSKCADDHRVARVVGHEQELVDPDRGVAGRLPGHEGVAAVLGHQVGDDRTEPNWIVVAETATAPSVAQVSVWRAVEDSPTLTVPSAAASA